MKLQKEHDYAVSKLNDWQKKFAARIKEVMDQVKAFRTKDRMSEAQDYLDRLVEIQLKLDEFYNEVSITVPVVNDSFLIVRQLYFTMIPALQKWR